MTDLSDFGAGSLPEKRDENVLHETRDERAKHRRRTYRLGRCRAIATSKGCRCGGPVIEETDGPLCYYHGSAYDPPMIDDPPGLVARWCGQRATRWGEIPSRVRAALCAVDPKAKGR